MHHHTHPHTSVPLVHVQAGDSEDEELVTVVEKEKFDVERKAVMVTDRFRTVEKVLLCENLQDFLIQGKGPRLSERSNFVIK